LIDKSDTLVINTIFQDVAPTATISDVITVKWAKNVYFKWTDIVNPKTTYGININDSSNITIDDCEVSNHIRPTGVHSSAFRVNKAPNTYITACSLYDLDGNGILTEDITSTGITITGCTIRNVGRVPLSSTAPFHGIYSKAPDATITNNTISASLDGSGITMRSTGTITGNTLSSCKHSLIAYWPDATAGASGALVISKNSLTQDNYDNIGGSSKGAIICINDNGNEHEATNPYFQTFRIEKNIMLVKPGSASTDAMVTANWSTSSLGYGDVRVTGNSMSDRRTTKNYFDNDDRFVAITPNTLK
jgi:parallel beta-helix repeat protein